MTHSPTQSTIAKPLAVICAEDVDGCPCYILTDSDENWLACSEVSYGRKGTYLEIARAVNAHDELVKQLKICADCLESFVEQQYPDYYREYPSGRAKYESEMSVVKDARAALAKAGV